MRLAVLLVMVGATATAAGALPFVPPERPAVAAGTPLESIAALATKGQPPRRAALRGAYPRAAAPARLKQHATGPLPPPANSHKTATRLAPRAAPARVAEWCSICPRSGSG